MKTDKLIDRIKAARKEHLECFDKFGNWIPGKDVSPLEEMADEMAERILADAEPAEPRQPTVQEAARVLLSDKTAAHELAINLMRRHKKTKGTEKGGYYPALCYALRALAEGDNQ